MSNTNNTTNTTNTTTISCEPYYDSIQQCYLNILTVNHLPQGPLKKFVRSVKQPLLSKLFEPSYNNGYNGYNNNKCNNNRIHGCKLALTQLNDYNGCCSNANACYMTPDDIDDLVGFLLANGYQIETQISQLLQQMYPQPSTGKKVFTITYYDNTPPNITYMR